MTATITPGGPVLDLPPLTGTPRQIEWASKIRDKAIRLSMSTLCSDPASQRERACDLMLTMLTKSEASVWIDARFGDFNAAAIARDAK